MRLLIILPIVMLFGCSERPEIEQCKNKLLSGMASPSTFKEIKSDAVEVPGKKQSVSVEYDYQNEFGATIREKAICVYQIDGKNVVSDKLLEYYPTMRADMRTLEKMYP